ncbi:hypothetical protein [Hyphomonas sp.]|jgi:sterol desaturase/sphingolipid hydroxylase (fatty acid hydroxylase superfamily)|uniref:hypothetical protein n=1 Tax=Hyphomonas sp. TaxID=87 RepID=UPI0032D8E5ED
MADVIYWGLVVASFLFAFILSTLIIRIGIPKLKTGAVETKSEEASDPLDALIRYGRLPESSKAGRVFDWQSTGIWIGLTETLLIFVLVFAGAFNALAIIIGAKQFVRNEQIRLIPSYYLLGTLANLCIAVLFALIAKHGLGALSLEIASGLDLQAQVSQMESP